MWRRLPWNVLRLGSAGAGRALGVISVWAAWERLMLKVHRVEPARPDGLFTFRLAVHRGADRRLQDGTAIHRGDRLVELHLDNRRLLAMRKEPAYSTWRAVRILREDLTALGSRLAAGDLGHVVAIHGTSLMGAAGASIGFEATELPHTWRTAFERYFLAGLDAMYHPAGLERLQGRALGRWPVEVWMSSRRAIALVPPGTARPTPVPCSPSDGEKER